MKTHCRRALLLTFLAGLSGCALVNRRLARAVDANDLGRAESALADGANVDVAVNGEPAIIDAAMRGRGELVVLLLRHGAKVDGRDSQGMTPLIRVAWLGRTEIARLLLDHGAQVDARNNGGESALMAAAAAGRVGLAELLLGRGANVNARDAYGRTVLDYAGQFGQPGIREFLIAHGARAGSGSNRAARPGDHPGLPPIHHYLRDDR